MRSKICFVWVIASAMSILLTGCVLDPWQGQTAPADDTIGFIGGSPVANAVVVIQGWNGSSFQTIGSGSGASEINEQGATTYGDFYVWQDKINAVTIPSSMWINNRARVRVLFQDPDDPNALTPAYTYDDAGIDCLNALIDGGDVPLELNDYTSCSYDQTGIINICRHGTTWNGSACL